MSCQMDLEEELLMWRERREGCQLFVSLPQVLDLLEVELPCHQPLAKHNNMPFAVRKRAVKLKIRRLKMKSNPFFQKATDFEALHSFSGVRV